MVDKSDCVATEEPSAGSTYGGGAVNTVLGKYLGSRDGFPEMSEWKDWIST